MAPSERVCAVVLDLAGEAAAGETRGAVERQDRPPDDLVVVSDAAGIAAAHEAGLRAALEGHAAWVWLLDGSALPAQEALGELLEAVHALGDVAVPALVATKVTDAAGHLDRDAAPMPRVTNVDFAFAAYERRLLSVRAARGGSLLVRRQAIERHGAPRRELADWGADLEWTARLVADDVGVLAPRSVAVRKRRARVSRDIELRARTAMLFGDAFSAREKLWLAFTLGNDALDCARSPRRAARVARSLASGAAIGFRARALG